MLNVVDEFTHECLAICVARKLKATDIIDMLADLFISRGVPGYIRSHNGPEFITQDVRGWFAAVGAKTASIEPGSPRENRDVESFNARLRDELLNGEIFYSLREAEIILERWRRHTDTVRPHASLATGRPPQRWLSQPPPGRLRHPRPAPPARLLVEPRPVLHCHSARAGRWG
jgi:transposase InsO family protein